MDKTGMAHTVNIPGLPGSSPLLLLGPVAAAWQPPGALTTGTQQMQMAPLQPQTTTGGTIEAVLLPQPQAQVQGDQLLPLLPMQPQVKAGGAQPALQHVVVHPQATQSLPLPQLQQQVKAGTFETQLVELQPKANVEVTPALQMPQLLLQGGAEDAQPVQSYQLKPQTKTDGEQAFELFQLQPQTRAVEMLQAEHDGQLQYGQKSICEPLQSTQQVLLPLPAASTGVTETQPLNLLQIGSSAVGSQPILSIPSSPAGMPVSQPIQLLALPSDQSSQSVPVIEVKPFPTPVDMVPVSGTSSADAVANDVQISEMPKPLAGSNTGLTHFLTPPSKTYATSTQSFDCTASEALLQYALKSMTVTGTVEGPTIQNMELKMDGLQGQATMPIIVGQNIKLVPDTTQGGGMSLTQNLQVAMVPVQKLAALQGSQAGWTTGMPSTASARPPTTGVAIAPKPAGLPQLGSNSLTSVHAAVPALAPEKMQTAASAQQFTTIVPLPNNMPPPVAAPGLATSQLNTTLVTSSPMPSDKGSVPKNGQMAPMGAASSERERKEKNKTKKNEGGTATKDSLARLCPERDPSKPLLLLDIPGELLEAAAASSGAHYIVPSGAAAQQHGPQSAGCGELANLDISQFPNVQIKPGCGERSTQKRTAEQAGLSPPGAGFVVGPSTNSNKEVENFNVFPPEGHTLDPSMRTHASNPASKISIPCVTYSEEIAGHRFAPSLIIQRKQQDCDISIDEICLELQTEPEFVEYVAVHESWHRGERAGEDSSLPGPSNRKKCRVIPMCISGQTFSRRKTPGTGKVPEVHAKIRSTEMQGRPTHVECHRENGELSDSNTEEGTEAGAVSLEDGCDASTASGNKQQCPIDDAGNEMRYGCYTCEFVAGSMWDVTDHWMKTHLSEKPYVCHVCRASFKTSFMAASHMRKCCPERPATILMKPSDIYKEPLFFEVSDYSEEKASCDAGPQESSFQIADVPASLPLEDEVSELCDEQGRLIKFLKEVHSGTSKTPDGYACNKCGATTATAIEMELHVKEDHRRARPYGCRSCNEKFVCAFDLKRHQLRQHEPEVVLNNDSEERSDSERTGTDEISTSWTDAYTCTYSGMMLKEYCCKKCDFKTKTEAAVVLHAIVSHKFVSRLACQQCKYRFPRNQPLLKSTIKCPKCNVTLQVSQSHCLATHYTNKHKVFACRMCEYKSQDKSGMTRHIKYSHTTVRPYMCGYCEYSSVEKPKVRLHLFNHHRSLPSKVIRDDEMVESFRRCLPELFDKLTYVFEGSMDDLCKLQFHGSSEKVSENIQNKRLKSVPKRAAQDEEKEPVSVLPSDSRRKSKRRMPLKLVDGVSAVEHTLTIRHVSTTSRGTLQCDVCGFTAKTWARCAAHVQQQHMAIMQQGSRPGKDWCQKFKPPYFRCTLCDYKCYDRSCMSRHIKYIHFDVHPHQCPACPYRKVEKAKVRLHIKTHHPELGAHADAITDRELFSRCTREAKRYYCLVTERGEESPSIPAALGPEATPLPLYNTRKKPLLPPNVPVPQYVVLNCHAATHTAQLATPGGDIVNVNLTGYIKLEDGAMIKTEPSEADCGDNAFPQSSFAPEPVVKTEPDNEYPGERADMAPENQNELEIIKEVLKPTKTERIEVVVAEDGNEDNADKQLVDFFKMDLGEEGRSERASHDEDTEEGDEEDCEESSADEYQPDSEDTDSAEEEEDMTWRNLTENIGKGSEDFLTEAEQDGTDVDADIESMPVTRSAKQKETTSVSVLTDEKLTKMKPVVELTDVVQQILAGKWTL